MLGSGPVQYFQTLQCPLRVSVCRQHETVHVRSGVAFVHLPEMLKERLNMARGTSEAGEKTSVSNEPTDDSAGKYGRCYIHKLRLKKRNHDNMIQNVQ